MSNCLGIKKEKIKTPVSGLNGLSQNIKWKLKTIISNEDRSFAEPVDFLFVDKITEFTPSSSLDISKVEIPKFLTKSYNELSDNHPLAKQRFQNSWRRFGHDSELYQQYREIIRDYTDKGIIEEVKTKITDNKLKRPVCYLPHQAVRKDGRLTSKTRIVFDAGSHQNNELSLNDCLWPGINLNPNLLDILINFRLNAIAFCSDIKQAFLQICLADEHKDGVRFLWSDDEPCVHKRPKLQVYRFNRVNFGVSSSPFLLAATIRHIDKYINMNSMTL
ncbi:DUF1758 domain-containing protein [Trichonephila clavipes]|nr:DUF1758 domain-containing protein [Trichonephila clavipes]